VRGPALRRGDIVVRNKMPLHRTLAVREVLEGPGVSVPTFPITAEIDGGAPRWAVVVHIRATHAACPRHSDTRLQYEDAAA